MAPGGLEILILAIIVCAALIGFCKWIDGRKPSLDEDEPYGEQNNPSQIREWRAAHFPDERKP